MSLYIRSLTSEEETELPLFPDPISVNSALDRLAHTSYQILIEEESIRKQNRPN